MKPGDRIKIDYQEYMVMEISDNHIVLSSSNDCQRMTIDGFNEMIKGSVS